MAGQSRHSKFLTRHAASTAAVARVLLFLVMGSCITSGCNKTPTPPAPPTLREPALPKITVIKNDLLDGKEPALKESLELDRERVKGVWEFRHGKSDLGMRFLPPGHYRAPITNCPDGNLKVIYDGFDLGSGVFTFDVVFQPQKKQIILYEAGQVQRMQISDAAQQAPGRESNDSTKSLGIARLLGENLLEIDAVIQTPFANWELKTILVKQNVLNEDRWAGVLD